jgi:uncharacterized coiled-coil protein SlyX
VRELATIEELEKRISKLEERILGQDKAIKSVLDLVQRAIDTQFKQWKEDQELFIVSS